MEDWGYAAGWDTASVTPCIPTVNGGYDRAKTDYGRSGKVQDVYLMCTNVVLSHPRCACGALDLMTACFGT